MKQLVTRTRGALYWARRLTVHDSRPSIRGCRRLRDHRFSQVQQLGVHAESRLSGCGYIDFESNSVSIDNKIGGPPVFGKTRGLADNEHCRSLCVPNQGCLLVL